MRKTDREKFTETITVQERDCEDCVVVPVRFLKSLRDEIDGLRAQLGLSPRLWESPKTDAVSPIPAGRLD